MNGSWVIGHEYNENRNIRMSLASCKLVASDRIKFFLKELVDNSS
jgi:hypothetical protein